MTFRISRIDEHFKLIHRILNPYDKDKHKRTESRDNKSNVESKDKKILKHENYRQKKVIFLFNLI